MSSKSSLSKRAKPSSSRPLSLPVSRAGGSVLRSATVGALPVVNRLIHRTRLEEFLRDALPKEDGRTKLSTTKALGQSQQIGSVSGCPLAKTVDRLAREQQVAE